MDQNIFYNISEGLLVMQLLPSWPYMHKQGLPDGGGEDFTLALHIVDCMARYGMVWYSKVLCTLFCTLPR